MTHRSWLFVPGDSPGKMEKALESGADAVILDLEDSVGAAAKGDARFAVRNLLRRRPARSAPELWVRINAMTSPDAALDLATIVQSGPAGIGLPKVDTATDVVQLGLQLAALEAGSGLDDLIRILPIATETPLSVFNLHTYRAVGPRMVGLTWGAEDLSAAVGASVSRLEDGSYTPLYELARSLCVAGAAAANVPAIETVYPSFRDLEGLAAYAARGRRDGFVGMMAIHPAQVPVINEVFSPAPAEILHALRVVELFDKAPGSGVQSLDGRMLDAPHLLQARSLLARAEAVATPSKGTMRD